MRRGVLILAFLAPAGLALVLTTAQPQVVRAQDGAQARAQARMQARIKALEGRLELLEKNLELNNKIIEELQASLAGEARPSTSEPGREAGPPRPPAAADRPRPSMVVLPLNVKPVSKEDLLADPRAVASALVRVYRKGGESKVFHALVGGPIGKQVKTREGLVDYRVGTLLAVDIKTRKHPKLGIDQQVHVIRYRTLEGEIVEATHRDPPPE